MALAENPTLSEYTGFVQDSGEGRWTIQAAIEEAVPADVLTAALYMRFRSRQEHTFAEKMLSAMRQKFGGHVEPKLSNSKNRNQARFDQAQENRWLNTEDRKAAPALPHRQATRSLRHGDFRRSRRPHGTFADPCSL